MNIQELAEEFVRRFARDLGTDEASIRKYFIATPAWLELVGRYAKHDFTDAEVDAFYESCLAADDWSEAKKKRYVADYDAERAKEFEKN